MSSTQKSLLARWIVNVSLLILLFSFMLLLSGCGVIRETFRRPYVLADEFFDQLEADVRLFFNERSDGHDMELDEARNMNLILDDLAFGRTTTNLFITAHRSDSSRSEMISALELLFALIRRETIQDLEALTGDPVVLSRADVNRGLLGSIWFLIRRHWVITLIIIFSAIAAFEKLRELVEECSAPKINREKKNDEIADSASE